MRHFTIVPVQSDAKVAEVTTFDDAAVFYTASRMACEEAAVFEGNNYRYSLSRNSAGVWCIFQREDPAPARPSS